MNQQNQLNNQTQEFSINAFFSRLLDKEYQKSLRGGENMNWKTEEENIAKYVSKEYFKPGQGKYNIKILSEATERLYTDKATGETRDQIEMDIEVDGKKFVWTITKGLTKSSLFGQLTEMAKRNGYKVTGVNFTLLCKADGKGNKKEYTILECI